MKLPFLLFFIVSTVITSGCLQSNNKTDTHSADTTLTLTPTDSSIQTFAYRGVFSTIYDKLGVGQMIIKAAKGTKKGTYDYQVNYGENVFYEGEKVNTYHDYGSFTIKATNPSDTVLILKGTQAVPFYYLLHDNKLTAIPDSLPSSANSQTDEILKAIDLKDTVQTRMQVLQHYRSKTLK